MSERSATAKSGEGDPAARPTTNPWNPFENPVVVRAFRIGFRPGPGQYPLTWWGLFLAIALAIPFLPSLFGSRSASTEQIARWMLITVGLYLLAGFFFGGFQRMIAAFSKERERETFDFIHLSTMPSGSIVFGFLVAGQVPGYLISVLLLPLLAVCAFLTGFPLGILFIGYGCLVVYVLFLSILFLYLGFWTKKSAEFRGAAIVYVILGILFGGLLNNAFTAVGFTPTWTAAILGAPLFLQLITAGTAEFTGLNSADTSELIDAGFYGLGIPVWLLPLLIYLPLGLLLARALSRSLRHRDRPVWTVVDGTACLGWILFLAVGMWWGSQVSHETRFVGAGITSWVVIGALLKRNARSRARTLHDLGREGGRWSRLWRSDEGPPFQLGAALVAIFLLANLAIALSPVEMLVPESAGSDVMAARTIGYRGSWGVVLLLLAPLAATILWQQWMMWRSPRLRGLVHLAISVVVFGPYLVHLVGGSALFSSFGSIGDWLGRWSPVTMIGQLAVVDEAGELRDPVSLPVLLIAQGGILVLAVVGFRLCRGTARSLSTAATALLSSVTTAIDAIGEDGGEVEAALAGAPVDTAQDSPPAER